MRVARKAGNAAVCSSAGGGSTGITWFHLHTVISVGYGDSHCKCTGAEKRGRGIDRREWGGGCSRRPLGDVPVQQRAARVAGDTAGDMAGGDGRGLPADFDEASRVQRRCGEGEYNTATGTSIAIASYQY